MKNCTKCDIALTAELRVEGRRRCRLCHAEYQRFNHSRYYQKNKDKVLARTARYYADNREIMRLRHREYADNNKERLAKYGQKWQQENQEHRTAYKKMRRDTDTQYRLADNLRSRLRSVLKSQTKVGSAVHDLGCSVSELKSYLESKFTDGMSWDNYGRKGWHIDHIVPLSRYDLTDREQLLKACHFTNLQPLWAEDNLRKGAKLDKAG